MRKIGVFIVLLAVAMLSGCMGPIAVEKPVEPSGGQPVGMYILKALDPLYISFLGIPQEKQIEVVIDEHGQITLPYLQEPVRAAGLSTSELERKIQTTYVEKKIYQRVTINIQTSAKTYFMEGEVARPQEYQLTSRITLLQAIGKAGGPTDFANLKDVVITRHGENMKVNAKKIAQDPETDIPLEAGDRVTVNRGFL
jgi:polysaccharide export outer membrane protein